MEYSPLSNAKKRNLKLIQKKCKTDARKESKPPKKSKKNHHRRQKSPKVAEKVRAKFRDIGAATEKRLILDKGENAGLFNQGFKSGLVSKLHKARGQGNLVELLQGPSKTKRPNQNRPSWDEENKENIPPPPLIESPFTLNVAKPDITPKRTRPTSVFESPTSSKFEMPLKNSKEKTSTPKNSKLKKMYKNHINPLNELELERSHSLSRRVLQPLEISRYSSNSSLSNSVPFFDQFDDANKTRHSVQSWPQDAFTHPNSNFGKFQVEDYQRVQSWPQDKFTGSKTYFRKNQVDFDRERPDLQFEELNYPFSSNEGINPDVEDMASPSMQRLLNEQGLHFPVETPKISNDFQFNLFFE